MKNLLWLIIISSLTSCVATSQLSNENMNFKEGDDLIYEARAKDGDGEELKLDIELNINEVSEYGVSFDWEMSIDRSGTIHMNENAVQNATILSFFEKEGYQTFDDKTTIWLSQSIFKRLKNGKKVKLSLNEQQETFQMTGTETYSFGNKKDGVPYNIPVIITSNADNSIELWIADDAKNHIITMMTTKEIRMDLMKYKVFEY